jgi:hypothetical protein
MNIHDRARQMVAQSRGPMSREEAYSELARRAGKRARNRRLKKAYKPDISKVRLPYADND